MRKLETYGSIRMDEKTGKNMLFIHKRELFDKGIEFMPECRVRITVEKLYKKRSTKTVREDGSEGYGQNGYYWAILLYEQALIFSNAWGEYWSIERTHEYNKSHFWGDEKVNPKTGSITYVPGSSKDKTTVEFEEGCKRIRDWVYNEFDVLIHEPNEQLETGL